MEGKAEEEKMLVTRLCDSHGGGVRTIYGYWTGVKPKEDEGLVWSKEL